MSRLYSKPVPDGHYFDCKPDGLTEISCLFSSAEMVDCWLTSLMRRPCFTPQEATMGIRSDCFAAHSAAAFEALLHNRPLLVPAARGRRAGAALSLSLPLQLLNSRSRLQLHNLLVPEFKLFFWLVLCFLDWQRSTGSINRLQTEQMFCLYIAVS